jgi:hypothetical protein
MIIMKVRMGLYELCLMSGVIKLDTQHAVTLFPSRETKRLITALQVAGTGKIFACLLNFYRKDNTVEHQDILFHHPSYISAKTLSPSTTAFDISAFDRCEVKFLIGQARPTDELLLLYYKA